MGASKSRIRGICGGCAPDGSMCLTVEVAVGVDVVVVVVVSACSVVVVNIQVERRLISNCFAL